MNAISRKLIKAATVLFCLLAIFWVGTFWFLRSPVFFEKAKALESITIDPKDLEEKVRFLAAITPPRQYKNEKSMQTAEAFVQSEFEKLGYTVSRQNVPADNHIYHNILARFGDPTAKEVVVIGAHYDVCDDQPGADDNATGVTGVLELARLLKEQNPKLAVPVEFVIYSLEEPPFFRTNQMGSAVHAEALKQAGISVKYMVSLEMIGYFSDEAFSQHFDPSLLYLFYPSTGNFIGVVGSPNDREIIKQYKVAMSSNSTVPVVSINAPRFIPGVDFSDHLNYWKHNWPAIMITDTAFLRNDQYHEKGDTPDRLNYHAMAEVIRGVYSAILFSDQK